MSGSLEALYSTTARLLLFTDGAQPVARASRALLLAWGSLALVVYAVYIGALITVVMSENQETERCVHA